MTRLASHRQATLRALVARVVRRAVMAAAPHTWLLVAGLVVLGGCLASPSPAAQRTAEREAPELWAAPHSAAHFTVISRRSFGPWSPEAQLFAPRGWPTYRQDRARGQGFEPLPTDRPLASARLQARRKTPNRDGDGDEPPSA